MDEREGKIAKLRKQYQQGELKVDVERLAGKLVEAHTQQDRDKKESAAEATKSGA